MVALDFNTQPTFFSFTFNLAIFFPYVISPFRMNEITAFDKKVLT